MRSKATIVALVGFMGAGKSTVGRELARLLGWRFVDLDVTIERQQGEKIPALFRQLGETGFRALEAEALGRLLRKSRPGMVVALGGGAWVQPDNAKLLSERGVSTVFLDTPLEEIERRCARRPSRRPLFADRNQFRQLYEARRESYLQADVRVETGGKQAAGVAREIAKLLRLEGTHVSPQ